MSKRRRVALYIDIRGSYDHGIARGVIRYAKERRNWNLFGHGWTLNEIGNPERWTGDGIIARIRTRDEADALTAIGVPVVDVCQGFTHPQLNFVANDDFETGRAAGAYLRQCGFRRFAFCGVSEVMWSDLRFNGFSIGSEVEAGSIPRFDNALLSWEQPGTSARLRRWLKSLPQPIGILACNDTVGVKITAACQAEGLSIPTSVAVLGVDNEDVLCELADPTLSSVPCDCERMGYEAARLLDRLMKRRRHEPFPPVRVSPLPIVVRASTDVLAIDDELVTQALRFIRNSADLSINVNDVMRAVPASRRSLETRFSKIVGRTIHDEIRRMRLENACRLLAGTDLPVSKIAMSSGFSSHRRFHVVFCEHLKILPSKYRELKRGLLAQ